MELNYAEFFFLACLLFSSLPKASFAYILLSHQASDLALHLS